MILGNGKEEIVDGRAKPGHDGDNGETGIDARPPFETAAFHGLLRVPVQAMMHSDRKLL